MKSYTALILCAGFGKRLNPITLKKPKPLLVIKKKNLLSNTIEFILNLGVKEIKINTFYLSEQISNFISTSSFKNNVEIINDGNEILDTGGGVKNMIKYSNHDNFLIFNPDTIWDENYKNTIIKMINFYEVNKINNLLLVVNKTYSYDKRIKGDFHLNKEKLTKISNNQFIYTGLQIINKNLINNIKLKKFSMNKIWDNEINKSNLYGFEIRQKFTHLSDINVYNDLIKK